MSSSISEPADAARTTTDTAPAKTDRAPARTADGLPVFGSPDAVLDPDVEVTPRPQSEVGVLPPGSEADPIGSAGKVVGEVGLLPGVPLNE